MIRIKGLTKQFGAKETLSAIDLTIRKGEIFTLIGPSGSGKTTLLRIIDLLDSPTSGTYLFDGQDTATSEAGRLAIRRRMGMVFQKPAVLNTTVAENVAFGLRFRGSDTADIPAQVTSALELVGLGGFEGRRAITLSGGEMQRVALARTLVTRPEVLLLDEPTANLDPVSSELIEDLIIRINRESGTTIILSTHDMIQGQRLAHRIGVIIDGRLAQVGSSDEIFYMPRTRNIARFVGIDAITGGIVIENKGGHALIRSGSGCFEALTTLNVGARAALCFRPEEVTLIPEGISREKSSMRNQFAGRITRMVPQGPFVRVSVDCGFPITSLITRRSCAELGLSVGSPVIAGIKATAIHVLTDEERKSRH